METTIQKLEVTQPAFSDKGSFEHAQRVAQLHSLDVYTLPK